MEQIRGTNLRVRVNANNNFKNRPGAGPPEKDSHVLC
jgi:hypothetical protein